MITDQDKDKTVLAHTLMCHSIIFLDHFEKCQTKLSKKGKVQNPQKTFSNPIAQKIPKLLYENITIVDSDVKISSDEEWRDKK